MQQCSEKNINASNTFNKALPVDRAKELS